MPHKKRCPDCLGIGRAIEENRTELPPNQTAKMVYCPTCNGTGWYRRKPVILKEKNNG